MAGTLPISQTQTLRKKLGGLFAALLLGVQMLSFLHIAQHGPLEHKHHGQSCAIILHGEQAKLAGGQTDLSAPLRIAAPVQLSYAASAPVLAAVFTASSPRAPPFFS